MPGAFPVIAAPLPPQGREDERRADEENAPAAAPGPARVRPVRPTHHTHGSPPRLSPPTPTVGELSLLGKKREPRVNFNFFSSDFSVGFFPAI